MLIIIEFKKNFSEQKNVIGVKKKKPSKYLGLFILFLFFGVFILDKKNPTFIISRINRKMLGINTNKQEKLLFDMLPNHFGFFRFMDNQIDVTSFTSIHNNQRFPTGHSLYPFKSSCFFPSLVIKNGSSIQGLSGFSKILPITEDIKSLYFNYSENFNATNFCHIKKSELLLFSNFIDTNNIIIGNQNLTNLTTLQSAYLFELTLVKTPLPIQINQNNWCIFQSKYTKEEQIYKLRISQDFLRTNFSRELQPLIKIQKSIFDDLFIASNICSDSLSNSFFENITSKAIINRQSNDIFED